MRMTLPLFLSSGCIMFAMAASAQVIILNTDLTNPPATSCTETYYTISGTHACTNYGFGGPMVSVVGFNITIDMDYYSGFAPIPGLTPFSEDVNLGFLTPGTYAVTTNANLDFSPSSSDVGNITVVSCCTVAANFSLSSSTSCAPDAVTAVNSSTGATNYQWFVDGSFYSASATPTFSALSTGIHEITLYADNGNCTDSLSTNLEVFQPTSFSLGADTLICDTAQLILDPSLSNVTYYWQDASTNSSYTVNAAGSYWLSITDSNGCISTDSIVVATEDCTLGLSALTDPNPGIYPNPASEIVYILGLAETDRIRVVNLLGQEMLEGDYGLGFSVLGLQDGIYWLNFEINGSLHQEKLQVSR